MTHRAVNINYYSKSSSTGDSVRKVEYPRNGNLDILSQYKCPLMDSSSTVEASTIVQRLTVALV